MTEAEVESNAIKIKQALNDLGTKTVEEIVALLVEGGFRGYRGKIDACPLARYLSSLNGEVLVFGGMVAADDRMMGMPESASVFVAQFDEGLYPELDEMIKIIPAGQ